MYFWNIEKLKINLIENGLSQKSLFIYILLYFITSQFFVELAYIFPGQGPVSARDYIQPIIDLLAVGLGTYLCYYANGGESGRFFAERIFSIGFVVGLRFIVLLIPVVFIVALVSGIIVGAMGLDLDSPYPDYAVMLLMTAWLVAVYWRMMVHINEVARTSNA